MEPSSPTFTSARTRTSGRRSTPHAPEGVLLPPRSAFRPSRPAVESARDEVGPVQPAVPESGGARLPDHRREGEHVAEGRPDGSVRKEKPREPVSEFMSPAPRPVAQPGQNSLKVMPG